jgi:hypothetical protein
MYLNQICKNFAHNIYAKCQNYAVLKLFKLSLQFKLRMLLIKLQVTFGLLFCHYLVLRPKSELTKSDNYAFWGHF